MLTAGRTELPFCGKAYRTSSQHIGLYEGMLPICIRCCASGCCAHRGKPRVVEHVVVLLEEGVVAILLRAQAAR